MIHKEKEKQLINFTHNIALLRKQHKLSKKKMAEILHISVNSLNLLENNIIPPRISVDVVFAVWKYFGIYPTKQFSKKLEQ